MTSWNLTLSPVVSIENLQNSSEQHLFDQSLLSWPPSWVSSPVWGHRSRCDAGLSPACCWCEWGKTIYLRAWADPMEGARSPQARAPKYRRRWQQPWCWRLQSCFWATSPGRGQVPLHCTASPSLVPVQGQSCQKIGTILQIGDFSVLLKEGRGKSRLSLPCVSPFPSGKLSLIELKFWQKLMQKLMEQQTVLHFFSFSVCYSLLSSNCLQFIIRQVGHADFMEN